MGLLPLEFSDCILDSPYFRANLRAHEEELERTSQKILEVINDIHEVFEAAKRLSKAKKSLAKSLDSFHLECTGSSLTDDEIVISNSLKGFARFLFLVEEEMDRILENSRQKFIDPLAYFCDGTFHSARKMKKEFDKCTARSCQAQDRYANLSSKKEESLSEASESVRQEAKTLQSASLEYVYLIQVIQERKKFEFAESVLCFVRSWANYYEHGHSVGSDFSEYFKDLTSRIQKSRENYSITIERYQNFKKKMLHKIDPGVFNKMYTRQGYLYAYNKKSKLSGQSWTKLYCQYQAKTKVLTMIPYSQLAGKITTTESLRVLSCVCKEESLEKFRFVVTGEDASDTGNTTPTTTYILQALTDWDRKQWVEALGGTMPGGNALQKIRADSVEENLNSLAFTFLKDCLNELERRGLFDEGLYRVGGVLSKVKHLLNSGLDPQTGEEPLNIRDHKVWESKTIASAVKQYFRDLNKPLMTHQLYPEFVEAIKNENEVSRVAHIQRVLKKLPLPNREILKVLIRHLHKVSQKSDTNLMSASNLGVVFGPTLLRPREETVANIMDIKFCNEVVEILIQNCEAFFDLRDTESRARNGYRKCSVPEESLNRESAVPKRTFSFGSFSQIASANSLPDIKELAANGGSVDPPRSKSQQPEESLSSTNEVLKASLELMTSLAADLPNNSATFLRRSRTVHDKKVDKKPPLPKLSLVSPIVYSNKHDANGDSSSSSSSYSRRLRKTSFPAIVVPTVVTLPSNQSVSSLSTSGTDANDKSSLDVLSVESSCSSETTTSGSKYDNIRYDDLRSRDGDDENESEEESVDNDEKYDKLIFDDEISVGDSISDDSLRRETKTIKNGNIYESSERRRRRRRTSSSSNATNNEDSGDPEKRDLTKQNHFAFLQKMLNTGQTTDV